MALGPKAMGEAILQNLETKTGKGLAAWLAIVEASGLGDKKSVMGFLKTDHGLGHFQAQKVFEQFTGMNAYENPQQFITDLFNTSTLLEFYHRLESMIQNLGEDVRVEPCKTYIPFYRHTQFATVTVNRHKQVLLGLNLPDDFEHTLFEKAKTRASDRINFEAVLEVGADLEQGVKEVILKAYNLN